MIYITSHVPKPTVPQQPPPSQPPLHGHPIQLAARQYYSHEFLQSNSMDMKTKIPVYQGPQQQQLLHAQPYNLQPQYNPLGSQPPQPDIQQQQFQITDTFQADICLTSAAAPLDDRLIGCRKRRAVNLVPESQKTETYWSRRLRNNHSSRRSRQKRRQSERSLADAFSCLCAEFYADLLLQWGLLRARSLVLAGRPPAPEEDPGRIFCDIICYGLKEAFRTRGLGTSVCLPWREVAFEDLGGWTDRRFVQHVTDSEVATIDSK